MNYKDKLIASKIIDTHSVGELETLSHETIVAITTNSFRPHTINNLNFLIHIGFLPFPTSWHGGCYLHKRSIAEQELKVLNMSERHFEVSPLTEVMLADCSLCPHLALLEEGKCVQGDICVTAQSGRQIDRFLRRNPQLAPVYLNDSFWERRAIAARYAPLEMVRHKLRDPDEVVRRVVASRLPINELDDYLRDVDREVRMTVAERIAPERLTTLVNDEDYLVRLQVAKRIPHTLLRRMADDEDREVRKEVARRMTPFALSLLAKDEDAEVRRIVVSRMLPDDAAKMLADDDWVVRLNAVQCAPLECITELVDDIEPDVRSAVRQRLDDFLLGEN